MARSCVLTHCSPCPNAWQLENEFNHICSQNNMLFSWSFKACVWLLTLSEKVAFNPLFLWLFCGINVASQFQVVGVHFECIICRLFSDTSLRDGLFHEYKKFGKVMSVSIKGEKEDRFAIVTFKKYDVTLCHMNDFYGPTVLSIQLAFTTSHFQGWINVFLSRLLSVCIAKMYVWNSIIL